jgi:hypothetical protein
MAVQSILQQVTRRLGIADLLMRFSCFKGCVKTVYWVWLDKGLERGTALQRTTASWTAEKSTRSARLKD